MQQKSTVVALGMFDGVHMGHRAIFHSARQMANALQAEPCVVTFYNHPMTVFGKTPLLLTTAGEKRHIIQKLGLKPFLLPFTPEFALKSDQEFLQFLLHDRNATGIVVGFDYRFGHEAKGNIETLKVFCSQHHIQLQIVDAILYKGEKVSSSRIREDLAQGRLEDANAMLVDPYTFEGKVAPHAQIGRSLGFPTANLSPGDKVIPKWGVYTSLVRVNGQTYPGVTNVGSRPTFEDRGNVIIESHILDICGDLYNCEIDVSLLEFIREEVKFQSPNELKQAIQNDCNHALAYHHKKQKT